MFRGTVVSIHIAPEGILPMQQPTDVKAVRGRGLEGDRYFVGTGTFSKSPGAGREVTLIEVEAIEALREKNILLDAGDARRNLVTRGVGCGATLTRIVEGGKNRPSPVCGATPERQISDEAQLASGACVSGRPQKE